MNLQNTIESDVDDTMSIPSEKRASKVSSANKLSKLSMCIDNHSKIKDSRIPAYWLLDYRVNLGSSEYIL